MLKYLKNILAGKFGLKYLKMGRMGHTPSTAPVFDPRYKVVLFIPQAERIYSAISWVNDNTSNRAVDVKFVNHGLYIAFEDETDALIFKIKFL